MKLPNLTKEIEVQSKILEELYRRDQYINDKIRILTLKRNLEKKEAEYLKELEDYGEELLLDLEKVKIMKNTPKSESGLTPVTQGLVSGLSHNREKAKEGAIDDN